MAVFKYTAKDINAKKYRGVYEAHSREELITQLRSENLYLLKCEKRIDNNDLKKLKNKDLAEFCRELGTMISSGISLMVAMNIIIKRTPHKQLKHIYKDVYLKLQQGLSFSDALHTQKQVFPALMINMVKASEATGTLDITLTKLGIMFDKDAKLQNKIRSAMTYPLLLVVVTIGVVIAIFTMILPHFFELFQDMTLPLMTRLMFAISKIMMSYWHWIIIGILCLICTITLALKIPSVRYRWDKMKLKTVYIGHLTSIIYTSRFARSMNSLYSSGVSMINSLILVKSTINNTYIENQFHEVIRQVRNGTTLSQAISCVDGLDVKLRSSIYISEESGQLEHMLSNIANDFEYEAELATERLVTMLQPLMIIILGVIIGIVIISVILPLYSLYGSIG